MRTHTAFAALLLLTVSAFQLPAVAGGDTHAQLRLLVLDRTHAPLPGATVTVYTPDGKPGTTITADGTGVAAFSSLPSGLAQVQVKFPGFRQFVEKTTLKTGVNAQTITLELAPFKENVTVVATPHRHAGTE